MRRVLGVVMVTAAVVAAVLGPTATAAPPTPEPAQPSETRSGAAPSTVPPALSFDLPRQRTHLAGVEPAGGQRERLHIRSAAMGRTVTVDVLRGAGTGPRPVLYLLDGVDGAPVSGWLTDGGAAEFFAGRPVDVVLTSGGAGSLYSDWLSNDAALGRNQWETFLTRELPPIVEGHLGTTGPRGIAGVSMGAQAAMMLIQRHPGFYAAGAGLSGCYSTMDDLGRLVTTATVASRGGDVRNLWGPHGTAEWAAHDTMLGAPALRGTTLYLAAGNGVATPADLAAMSAGPGSSAAFRLLGGGSPLELGARICTERFAERLADLGIPATVDLIGAGMHTWPDFRAQLPRAWKVLGPALGVS